MSSLGTHLAEQASSAPGTGLESDTLARRVAADILRISSAVGLAQVLAFAAAPMITRLYNPEAFGYFAFFNAVVTILMPLASMRYEWALPLPSEKSSALDLLALCLLLVVGSSLALALLGPFAWPILAERTANVGMEVMLVPLAVLVLGLHGVVSNWLVRDRAFSQLAHVRFTTTVGTVGSQVGLGYLFGGSASLILGLIGGYLIGLTLAAYQCRGALSASAARMRPSSIRRVAAEYRSFGMISAPSGIVNAVGSQLPGMLLPLIYGLAITGQYSLAQRVLWQPFLFVGQAVYQVFWGNAARLVIEEPARLWPLFLRLNVCLLAGMAPGFVLTFFGAEIFALVFGSAWEQAGSFAGVMIVAIFLGMAAQSTTTLEIYRLNHWMSFYEFIRLILVMGALGAASWMALSPMICIVAITAAFAVSNATLLGLNALAIRRVKLGAAHTAP